VRTGEHFERRRVHELDRRSLFLRLHDHGDVPHHEPEAARTQEAATVVVGVAHPRDRRPAVAGQRAEERLADPPAATFGVNRTEEISRSTGSSAYAASSTASTAARSAATYGRTTTAAAAGLR
jgi:hypothetical protein